MSLHDSLEEIRELASMVMEDKKKEKEKEEQERRTVELVCPYCGVRSRIVWEDGRLPACPNCGASFDADDPQLVKAREQRMRQLEMDDRVQEQMALESAKTKKTIKRFIIFGIVMMVILAALVIVANLNGGSLNFVGDGSFNFHIGS